jgi:hypothetical protein
MKNFVPRCIAALAGNGAVMIALGNFLANDVIKRDAETAQRLGLPIGLLFLIALAGVILAYMALDLEETAQAKAIERLKWSGLVFFGLTFPLGVALLLPGFYG